MSNITLQGRMVSPGLTVNDLQRSIDFYVKGLGFEVTSRNEVEGKLRWVTMKAGGAEMSLGQDDFAKGKDRVKGVGLRFYISTKQELQPLADQAKAAGIVLDHDVMAMPWGQKAFGLTDPDGFKITIGAEM